MILSQARCRASRISSYGALSVLRYVQSQNVRQATPSGQQVRLTPSQISNSDNGFYVCMKHSYGKPQRSGNLSVAEAARWISNQTLDRIR
jgi:hypothetical protein